MRQVTGNMTNVVRGMDKAMDSMNLERVCLFSLLIYSTSHTVISAFRFGIYLLQISLVMDKFETQFSDLDVQTSYMEDAMSSTTATSTPQDQIETLLRQTAEEANIELQHDLAANKDVPVGVSSIGVGEGAIGEEDAKLAERLRALRPAT